MGWFDSIRRTIGETPDPSAWRAALGIQLDMIEAELRRLGWWQSTPASPEQMAFTRAFAADTMAFSQWLQYVFLPSARLRVAENALPPRSMVAAQAVRELDGVDEAGELCSLLARFDETVETRRIPD